MTASGGSNGGKPWNIVLIDDDEHEHRLIAHTLRAIEPLVLESFFSCEDVEARLEANAPDLILLDARLPPDNDPEHSIRFIRSTGCRTPIVLISSAERPPSAQAMQTLEKGDITAPRVLKACRDAQRLTQRMATPPSSARSR